MVQPGTESAESLLQKVFALGADLAGLCPVNELKNSPSHQIHKQIPANQGVGSRHVDSSKPDREVIWPEGAHTALVIAVRHPEDQPELDWWDGLKGTPGNRILIQLAKKIAAWVEDELGIICHKLPYHLEKGGIFLKDAAVLAGLGCIGKNNLLLTPRYGSRVRLRAMLLEADLPATGPRRFDPCAKCPAYCRRACPEQAFDEQVYLPHQMGQNELPGREGKFARAVCNQRMEANVEQSLELPGPDGKPFKQIKYCRLCETACPVGSENRIATWNT
jgi:epoxyqueuosine reductase